MFTQMLVEGVNIGRRESKNNNFSYISSNKSMVPIQ